ncbi:MAG: hypothetical protein UY35_C0008G0043 [Candidatus Saccharibacteria bacterium GW2011_GWC2_48_9]|nr:MAG: hypothetical protein UY35_C0008G0043 [Candidatus Saccharibacteria bacterium GW2011_GWC2_48_9]HCH35011.1 hypothetical protein [Candidatus Saccharibacteria bacterium]
MAETGNWREYIRPKEEFDVDMLCDYADHIIFSQADAFNIDHETEESRASWNSEDADVDILKRKIKAGTFTYQFGVHDKTHGGDIVRRVYFLPSSKDKVKLLNDTLEDQDGDTATHAKDLMQYLRTYQGVAEPRIDRKGRQIFQQLAAGIAVEAAMAQQLVTMESLGETAGTSIGEKAYAQSISHAFAQGVEASGIHFAYTHSEVAIREALADRLSKYKTNKPQPKAIEQRKFDR